ncbi:MAG: hypothetical protein P8R54_01515 [Myxococcota bacterium]|nr:hypothetical protein [Myxococcota bacterium]
MSTNIVDYYQRGWVEVQKNLFGWMIFYTAFMAVTIFTCGLGGILYPNIVREVRTSYRDGSGPQLSSLFNTEHLANDLINYLIYYGGILLGGAVGGIGGPIASLILQFQMPLAADDRYAPMDNAKLSLQHVSDHPGDHIVFLLMTYVLTIPTILFCLLPLPIVGPVLLMAHWLWYEDIRSELDTIASDKEIKQLSGPV